MPTGMRGGGGGIAPGAVSSAARPPGGASSNRLRALIASDCWRSRSGIVARTEFDLRRGILHIKAGDDTSLLPILRDVENIALGLDVVTGDLDLPLDAAQLHVVARHFGERRDERATPLVRRGIDVGIGGFDLAPHMPPDIELPRGVETLLPKVEGLERARR